MCKNQENTVLHTLSNGKMSVKCKKKTDFKNKTYFVGSHLWDVVKKTYQYHSVDRFDTHRRLQRGV